MTTETEEAVAEALASYDSAMTAAFQVLVHCLQTNGALRAGQYPQELTRYLDITKDKCPPVKKAILEDLRDMLLN
ncbi:hypothetical protein [Bradyrhizobium centrosematis]|uniref:hypothetical protein n=1 Tax=Bradyrhizobium centrosematis TaxID=1300039 RepID=UPI00388D9EC1